MEAAKLTREAGLFSRYLKNFAAMIAHLQQEML
jgi:hypothetical protein